MSIREIDSSKIEEAVRDLCIDTNTCLPADLKNCICKAEKTEKEFLPKKILGIMHENYQIAEKNSIPICQDTGMACVYMEIGQDVHINGNVEAAVNRGVRRGYTEGYLRKSVAEPLSRINTGDNTPALINYELVDGDRIAITFAPKGFGSENMNKIAMLSPSDGVNGVIDFVVDCVRLAGSKPCPPVVVGVGIGGNFEKAALLSKKALFRSVDSRNPDKEYAAIEDELLKRINELIIGPQGTGGGVTAFGVNVEHMPTHIAGLPVAVSIGCHVTRHKTVII